MKSIEYCSTKSALSAADVAGVIYGNQPFFMHRFQRSVKGKVHRCQTSTIFLVSGI